MPLASHGQLHSTSSRTKTPELPPVAYQIDALAPTHFGGCQSCWGVGGGGAENAIWRTQVFRAISERRRVLESERGSAGVTRETLKRKDVVGVRLEPRTEIQKNGKENSPPQSACKHRSCRPILGAHGRSQEARLIVFVAGVGLGFARQVDAVLIDDLLRAKRRGTGTRSVSSGAEG